MMNTGGSSPTPTYDIHTVTTACSNTNQVASYFKALGYTDATIFLYMGNNQLTNNQAILYSCNGQTNVNCIRFRNNELAASAFSNSYDCKLSVGDKFIVLHPYYPDGVIDIPTNIGIGVTELTVQTACSTGADINSAITANRISIPKIIKSYRYLAYALKDKVFVRMNSATAMANTNVNDSRYEGYLYQGDKLWEIRYN